MRNTRVIVPKGTVEDWLAILLAAATKTNSIKEE